MLNLIRSFKKFLAFPPIPDPGPLRDAYEAGYTAESYARNPHPKGTQYYEAWSNGKLDRDKEEYVW
jgi:hypothetical protein